MSLRVRHRRGCPKGSPGESSPTQRAMEEIFAFLKEKKLVSAVGTVYDSGQIKEAAAARDEGRVNGKSVVTV